VFATILLALLSLFTTLDWLEVMLQCTWDSFSIWEREGFLFFWMPFSFPLVFSTSWHNDREVHKWHNNNSEPSFRRSC